MMTQDTPEHEKTREYRANLASTCQNIARSLTYNDRPIEAKAKHTLLEASHALDSSAIRVGRDMESAVQPGVVGHIMNFLRAGRAPKSQLRGCTGTLFGTCRTPQSPESIAG